jgi:hypothetical protein
MVDVEKIQGGFFVTETSDGAGQRIVVTCLVGLVLTLEVGQEVGLEVGVAGVARFSLSRIFPLLVAI